MGKESKQSSSCACSSLGSGGALSERELEMVAIGAAIAGNCISCLEWHYAKCIEIGFTKEEMQEAFARAKIVKEMPNKKIYETARKLNK